MILGVLLLTSAKVSPHCIYTAYFNPHTVCIQHTLKEPLSGQAGIDHLLTYLKVLHFMDSGRTTQGYLPETSACAISYLWFMIRRIHLCSFCYNCLPSLIL